MQKITNSEKETFAFAKSFAKKLKGGEILGLVGDLGAGKTAFTKGIAAGMGIKKNITSPTFVLMKIYNINSKLSALGGSASGGKNQNSKLIHIDAYRLKSRKDLTAIGAEEYFNRPDTITVIEWANKIKKILPKKAKFVIIKNTGGDKRSIKLN
jgi:tRNA threonylcarbamoyladenosine biosynthesis protein TsaE